MLVPTGIAMGNKNSTSNQIAYIFPEVGLIEPCVVEFPNSSFEQSFGDILREKVRFKELRNLCSTSQLKIDR
jgi:hypothetical protein